MADNPETIGRYQVIERVGRGGMGVLYRAHDPALERDVALKMMHLDFTVDSQARERFQREARAVARLQHPNIVTIHELGEYDNAPFIVMEFLGGHDLEQLLQREANFSLASKLGIVEQVCEALAYAHQQGIVHRDIKPANVRVLDDGTVKILDFGIARFAASSLTQSGAVMGTPSYMAPEQIMSQPVDGRADLFAAGVLLYELLCGKRPFTGDSPTAVAYNILHKEPVPLTDALKDVPDAVAQIVTRALRKNPDDRYGTAREMASDLHSVRSMLDLPLSATSRALADEQTTVLPSSELLATGVRRREPVRPAEESDDHDPHDIMMRTSEAEALADAAPSSRIPQKQTNPVALVGGIVVLLAVVAIGLSYFLAEPPSDSAPAEIAGDTGAGGGGPGDPAGPGDAGGADPTGAGGGTPPAAPPPPRIFRVVSEPAGASILLDGVDTGRVTPADLELTGPDPERLELRLDTFDPLMADVSDADLEAGEKTYTLVPAERPVRLTVTGDYAFELVRGDTVISEASTSHDVTIQPGSTVTARNASYLLNSRLSINFRRSRQSVAIDAPGTLRVFSANETCSVIADGRDLSFPPIPPMPVAAGSHSIVLRCPDGTESRQTAQVASGEVVTVRFGGEERP